MLVISTGYKYRPYVNVLFLLMYLLGIFVVFPIIIITVVFYQDYHIASVYVSISKSIHLSGFLFIYLSIYLPPIYLFIFELVYISIYTWIYREESFSEKRWRIFEAVPKYKAPAGSVPDWAPAGLGAPRDPAFVCKQKRRTKVKVATAGSCVSTFVLTPLFLVCHFSWPGREASGCSRGSPIPLLYLAASRVLVHYPYFLVLHAFVTFHCDIREGTGGSCSHWDLTR